jgi:hypothetical protein
MKIKNTPVNKNPVLGPKVIIAQIVKKIQPIKKRTATIKKSTGFIKFIPQI